MYNGSPTVGGVASVPPSDTILNQLVSISNIISGIESKISIHGNLESAAVSSKQPVNEQLTKIEIIKYSLMEAEERLCLISKALSLIDG
jgi:hypothetical protein